MRVITTNGELKKFCCSIESCEYIAIDTEFSREKTYYPEAYLVQISGGDENAIIDLMSTELISFEPILQNENIVKIFHAAKQDLEILYRYFGKLPKNIFDTQIAASLCGFGYSVSYEELVYKLLGVQLDKTHQVSDWSIRPLNEQQLTYALADVIYLQKLYPLLIDLLQQSQRLEWAIEDNNLLNQTSNFTVNFEQIWKKIKNVKEANIVLKDLAIWREKKAQEMNLPRNHFIHENIIIKLAEYIPIEQNQVLKIHNKLPAEEIVNVIKTALRKNVTETILAPEKPTKLLKIKKLLNHKAKELNIPAPLIATSQELKDFLYNPNEQFRFLRGWRYEVFGALVSKITAEI